MNEICAAKGCPTPESSSTRVWCIVILTPMEATLNIQEIDLLILLAPGFHYISNVNCNIWLVDNDMLKYIESSSIIVVFIMII